MSRTGLQARARATAQASASATPGPRSSPDTWARLRYAFDNSMTRGTPALVAWLGLLTLLLILSFSVFLLVTGWSPPESDDARPGFAREMFLALMHALDPGTVAGDQGTWRYLITMLVLTLVGLFLVSALIGVISAGIDNRLAELRRGRSRVLERDHTIILGWSDSVYTVLSELAVANQSRRRPVVVVLADRDKVEMEEAIKEKVDLGNTRLVCRSGTPMDPTDLALASPESARAAIVLSHGGEDADTESIKTLLALRAAGHRVRTVVEIEDPHNLEAANLVAGDNSVVLNKQETVARLIVQTSRQSGAAAVYTELFDFDGDEIYFHRDPRLDPLSYREALLAYQSASVIGIVRDGVPTLNPTPGTPVRGCELIVVARDDSALKDAPLSGATAQTNQILDAVPAAPETTQILILGWNHRARAILRELDNYAEPGSRLTLVSEFDVPALPALGNLTVRLRTGATSHRDTLEGLDPASYDQVIVLAYADQFGQQKADARTLVTLLHLRELLGEGSSTSVVSEILDDRNRVLAEVAHVDDVIVSDKLTSLMIAQLSEESRLKVVFDDLLDEEGAEIYMRDLCDYVEAGTETNYATLVAAAARRGETALGYRQGLLAGSASAGYGVTLNPGKHDAVTVLPGDRLIVLAND